MFPACGGTLPHVNLRSCMFKGKLIHSQLHEVNATPVFGIEIFDRQRTLICAFVASSSGEPQKRELSVAQCRSDAAAWNKEEDTGPKDKDVGYHLPFGELLKRQREMMGCMKLTGRNEQRNVALYSHMRIY
jgi:hypothetical protein